MILAVIFLLCSFYLIRKWRIFRFENISNFQLSLAFVTKLFGAFILYYVYTEIYRDRQTADIFKFYDDSLALTQVFFDSPADFIKIIIGIHEDHFLMDYFINMNHWDNSYESVITNESRVVIKLCAIINLISMNNYMVNVIIFTMLSLYRNNTDHKKSSFIISLQIHNTSFLGFSTFSIYIYMECWCFKRTSYLTGDRNVSFWHLIYP